MPVPAARFAALAAALLIAACGSEQPRMAVSQEDLAEEERVQNALALEAMLSRNARLLDIAFPLVANAAELCGEKIAPGFGVNAADLSAIREELRAAAAEHWTLGSLPQIMHVVPGSPAAKAGLRNGDKILALGEDKIAAEDGAAGRVMDRLHAGGMTPLVFTVAADGVEARRVTVAPVPVCDIQFYIGKSDAVNAYANDDSVIVMAGMLRFAATDEDLALVLAHEMAHNVLADRQTMPIESVPGAIVDFVVSGLIGIETGGAFSRGGGRSYIQDYEAQADYVGLYIMARAGFDVSGAPGFWRRIAANYPGSIKDSLAAAHPASPYRFVLLKETVKEIEAKRAQGVALLPDPARLEGGPAVDPSVSEISPAAGGE